MCKYPYQVRLIAQSIAFEHHPCDLLLSQNADVVYHLVPYRCRFEAASYFYFFLLCLACPLASNQSSEFDVKLFGMGRDIMGLYEQNRILMIGTKVLFYM